MLRQVRSSLIAGSGIGLTLGSLLIGLLAVPMSSEPAQAQTCSASDKDASIAFPGQKDQVELYCFEAYSKCTDGPDKQKILLTCKTDEEKRLASPPPPAPTGVCTKQAVANNDHFYRALAPFKLISENLSVAISGLHPATGTLPSDVFGPAANPAIAQVNREDAKKYLEKVQRELDGKVALYSTLSSPDCFECAVLEKYAVLRGALNLVNESYTFDSSAGTEIGVQVGVNEPNKFVATKDDPNEQGALGVKTKREIAKRLTGIYAGEVNLNDVSDQWVSGVDPQFVAELKTEICNLANATNFNQLYRNGDLYFSHAQNVQRIINRAFLKNQANNFTSIFKKAGDAENAVPQNKRVKLTDLYAQYGPSGSDKDKKCGPSDIEMKAFDPEFYRHPKWCD